MEFKVQGSYVCRKGHINEKGEEVVTQSFSFKNIITDYGLDRISAHGNAGPYLIFIGTGVSTPTAGDTVLASPAASRTAVFLSTTNTGAPLYKRSATFSAQFPAGTLNGNYTELGLSFSPGGSLVSRALTRDALGNIAAITVLSNEFLTVEYTLELIPSLSDSSGTFLKDGVAHSFTARIANAAGTSSGIRSFSARPYSGGVGGILGTPSGNPGGVIYAGVPTRVSTGVYNHPISWNLSQNITNNADFKSFEVGMSMLDYQIEVSPSIPKNNTIELTMTFQTILTRI